MNMSDGWLGRWGWGLADSLGSLGGTTDEPLRANSEKKMMNVPSRPSVESVSCAVALLGGGRSGVRQRSSVITKV